MRTYLFFLLLTLSSVAFAQNTDSIKIDTSQMLSLSGKVGEWGEVAPQFPGGEQGLINYITDNLKYPKKARRKGIQGKVFVTFVIEKDGSLSTINVAKGVHPLLDEEAVRLVKNMPAWKPGWANGQPVKVRFTLPLNFKVS